jgi:hypothetical protein
VESDWRTKFINSPEEASRSGMGAIKLVTGTMAPPDRKPGKFADSNGKFKDQLTITLENAQVLEMDKGKPAPELEDDKWHCYMPYALPNEDPDKNAKVTKTIIRSAKELWKKRGQPDKGWLDLVGQQVTIERRDYEWSISQKPAEEGGERKKESGTSDAYYFVENKAADPEDLKAYVKALILGKKKGIAFRDLNGDAVVSRHPEFKEAFQRGTIGDLLGVKLDEAGIYQPAS